MPIDPKFKEMMYSAASTGSWEPGTEQHVANLFRSMLAGMMDTPNIIEVLEIPLSVPLLVGAVMALQQSAKLRTLNLHGLRAVDVCGTGGDMRHWFNVSTAAAIAAASCDVLVAKHCGSASTGKSGSRDVLAELGLPLFNGTNIKDTLYHYGVAFIDASSFHKLARRPEIVEARKAIGKPTVMNLAMVLSNPANPRLRLIGTWSQEAAEIAAEALVLMNCVEKAWVVCGPGGADELAPGENIIIEVDKAGMSLPKRVKLGQRLWDGNSPEQTKAWSEIAVTNAAESAGIIRGILLPDPMQTHAHSLAWDIVSLNAAAAMIISGTVKNFPKAFEKLNKASHKGYFTKKMDQLRLSAITASNAPF